MPVAAPHCHKTSEDAARSAERKHGLAARPLRREGQCSTNAEVNTASWSIQVQENDVCLTGQTEGRGEEWRERERGRERNAESGGSIAPPSVIRTRACRELCMRKKAKRSIDA